MHRIVICLMCKCFSKKKKPKDLVTLKELHKNNHETQISFISKYCKTFFANSKDSSFIPV
jgi:hypothetical protein